MNGIICINKPEAMTSFDVVAKIRRYTRAKVGHSGTLDPMATGVLVLALNQGTKALPYLGIEDKTYHAKIKFGLRTHTGDIWGDTEEEGALVPYDEAQLKAVVTSLIGKQNQRVPKVSAKKIDGKRSYDYILEGKEVKQLYADVEVYAIDVLHFDAEGVEFIAHVSSGTYIRTLCEDIATGLGMIGAMSYLKRTQVGRFTLEDCIELDALDTLADKLIPTKEAIQLPKIENERMIHFVKNGKTLKLDILEDRVLVDAGEYYAVYERIDETTFKSVRGLW